MQGLDHGKHTEVAADAVDTSLVVVAPEVANWNWSHAELVAELPTSVELAGGVADVVGEHCIEPTKQFFVSWHCYSQVGTEVAEVVAAGTSVAAAEVGVVDIEPERHCRRVAWVKGVGHNWVAETAYDTHLVEV